MIIESRVTRLGSVVPQFEIDDEGLRLLAGRPVFSRGKYLSVVVDRKIHLLHRYLWQGKYGTCPPMVDHINRNVLDNRFENLRAATPSMNNRNRRYARRCGLPTGVYPTKSRRKPFIARALIDGRLRSLGCFATAAEASEAFEAARKEMLDRDAAAIASPA